jgi:hypothetical protein
MAMAGYESTAVGIMMPVSRQWPAPAVLDEPPVAVLRLQVCLASLAPEVVVLSLPVLASP